MGPYRSSPAVAVLLLTIFTVSSALDMSIISYDNSLGDGKSTGSWRTDDEVMSIYEGWLAEHGKAYNALGEKERRFQIFKDNLRYIDEQNSKNLSYKLGLNRFADLSNDEYRNTYLGTKTRAQKKRLSNRNTKSDRYAPRVGDSLPDSIDWREEGAVNPIKDQGSCGSCWAFSTISAVEGVNKLVTGDLISLSEQELVDCDTTYNEGCNGGLMDYAFEFIIKNGGIDSEEDYPYKGYDATCDPYRKNARVVSIDTYEDVPVNSENALKKAVANQPIAVAIEGGGRDFQLYNSGVFTGRCGTALDHGVTVVGYGTDKGLDYWIVRNSWGASWGEKGYIRMQRNLGNTANGICGIAMEPSYPIKKGQNPPNPGPSPPSPIKPPSVCDNYYSCPESNTCCCIYQFGNYCFDWGCCPLEGATCCDDHYSCCPSEYPVCDVNAGACLMSKGNPLGVKALKRTPAKPHWAVGGGKSSSA
ncbi:hypothetical protein FF1_043114 [Malus domestica]|uniref:Cysteine protease n=1 Tax=Malus domestica TaxID=3750 RepID=A0A498JD61_MALDO|nr:low-temperature-induced cysteine proteinase-like [Malus domestica]RXH91652.1 hypothetical protein DVH24_020675 [Malus domestica]